MSNNLSTPKFVICIDNAGDQIECEPRKVYQILPDPDAERHKQLRVIDESGEDYLYPAEYFLPIRLPVRAARQLEQTFLQPTP